MKEYIGKELTNIDLVFDKGNSNFEIVGKKIKICLKILFSDYILEKINIY